MTVMGARGMFILASSRHCNSTAKLLETRDRNRDDGGGYTPRKVSSGACGWRELQTGDRQIRRLHWLPTRATFPVPRVALLSRALFSVGVPLLIIRSGCTLLQNGCRRLV